MHIRDMVCKFYFNEVKDYPHINHQINFFLLSRHQS
jgi:hypothetical protein